MKKAQPIRDGLDRKVPKWLAPVFGGREPMREWCDALQTLIHQVHLWYGNVYGELIDHEAIAAHLQEALRLMQVAMPHQQCWCPPNEHECPLCNGKRWLSAGEVLKALAAMPEPPSAESSASKGKRSGHR